MGLAVAHVICTPHLCRQWSPVCVISGCLFFFMYKSISLLSWNVHGLSQDDKCDDVLSELISVAPTIAGLQETKLSSLSAVKARSFLPVRLSEHICRDAGGIVLA